jgi:hypothetical protein
MTRPKSHARHQAYAERIEAELTKLQGKIRAERRRADQHADEAALARQALVDYQQMQARGRYNGYAS